MLQWMGGGRRKVKTTKKSIQARQHQFFEQRRQQLRNQTVQELTFDKYSRPHENIYSLDIASLKNLSQLAQLYANDQLEGTESHSFGAHKLDESKKASCMEENAGIYQKDNLHFAGSQPATSDLNTKAHERATVGTQWTPASAAAAAALSHHVPIVPEGICALPAKGLETKNENLNPEGKTPRIQASPKQETNIRTNHVQKRPLRQQRFEQFQILDFINDSHDGPQCKKDARSESYAAYVLEGMGNVPNCTPKLDKTGHKKTRHKEAIPACNSKHGAQQPPQALNKEEAKGGRCKLQLQRCTVSTMDDEHEAATDLESFSDSNGEHCSGECKMKTNDCFWSQYPREKNMWTKMHNLDSNLDPESSWVSFKKKGFPGSEFSTQAICKAENYQNLLESPKSVGLALDCKKFSICSDYGSAINKNMDEHMHEELLSDDDLRDFHSSLSSDDDGMQSFQYGHFTDEKLLPDDEFTSPAASSQPLFGKATHDFSFNSPAEEMFSESTFEFQVTILESSILEKELQSPSLWDQKLDATHEAPDKETYVDITPAHSQDDEFRFLGSPKHDDIELGALRNLTEHTCSIYDKAVATESSSVDTIFGTSMRDFPSSPTSPFFNQSHPMKLTFGRNVSN